MHRHIVPALLLLAPTQSYAEQASNEIRDDQAVQGAWELVLIGRGGKLAIPSDEEVQAVMTLEDGKMARTVVGIPVQAPYMLRPAESPKQIDVESKDNGETVLSRGIYVLRRSVLVMKFANRGAERPATIDFDPDEEVEYLVWGRISPPAK